MTMIKEDKQQKCVNLLPNESPQSETYSLFTHQAQQK